MSWSSGWLFPGAIRLWKNIKTSTKKKYYYNEIHQKWYKNKIEVPFNEILSEMLMLWEKCLYHNTFKQTYLSDYG